MPASLHTDGGARGNPGPAGIGVVLADEHDEVIADIARGIGATTNNVAEYRALVAGLELALERGIREVDVYLDSKLVVSQVLGEWKIKDERLRALAAKAQILMGKFDAITIQHVRREQNADADALANQGMDAAMLDVEDGWPEQESLLE
ncbi:MAG: ribonuclease HI family protein [Actinomycetota bacterium]|nr:ribonuclease HI family protein [Actinomycetota bacterium]